MAARLRKSKFVRLFDQTPAGVVCPHFYELILANGCPYNCAWCYLKGTFRFTGTNPMVFTGDWTKIQKEIESTPAGSVFNAGELADSLAFPQPLLEEAFKYFHSQDDRFLLLVTKAVITDIPPRFSSPQIIISLSLNCGAAAEKYEHGAPNPFGRLALASWLKQEGWRVRVRLDPVIYEWGTNYEEITKYIRNEGFERVTVGTLRYSKGFWGRTPSLPHRNQMVIDEAGYKYRYSLEKRVEMYAKIANWLGFQPALCKETVACYEALGWKPKPCNCEK